MKPSPCNRPGPRAILLLCAGLSLVAACDGEPASSVPEPEPGAVATESAPVEPAVVGGGHYPGPNTTVPPRPVAEIRADIERGPETAVLHTEAGNCLLLSVRNDRVPPAEHKVTLEQARVHFARAYTLDSFHVPASIGMASYYEAVRQPEKGIRYLEFCIQAEPEHHYCRVGLGAIYLELGAFDKADEQLRYVVDHLEGDSMVAAVQTRSNAAAFLANSLRYQGRTEEAEALLSEDYAQVRVYAERSPSTGYHACPHVALGQLYRSQGRDDQAATVLVEAAELEPFLAKNHYLAARQLYYNGDLETAADYITRALAIEDKDAYLRLQTKITAWQAAQEGGEQSLPPDGLLDAAMRAFDRMEWPMAAQLVDRAIAVEPSVRAETFRCFLLVAEGRFEDAEAAGGALQQRYPDAPGPKVVAAHVALAHRRTAQARELVGPFVQQQADTNFGLQRDSGDYDWLVYKMAMLAMAWAFTSEAEHDLAIEHFDAILLHEPDSIMALLGRGNCLNATGRLDDAEKHFRRVLALEPGNAHSLAELGLVQLNRGNVDNAVASFEAALETEPTGFTCPLEGMGLVYMLQGKDEQAAEMMESAIEANPETEYQKYNKLALIRIGQGDYAAARQLLERSIRNYPYDPEAARMLAELDAREQE